MPYYDNKEQAMAYTKTVCSAVSRPAAWRAPANARIRMMSPRTTLAVLASTFVVALAISGRARAVESEIPSEVIQLPVAARVVVETPMKLRYELLTGFAQALKDVSGGQLDWKDRQDAPAEAVIAVKISASPAILAVVRHAYKAELSITIRSGGESIEHVESSRGMSREDEQHPRRVFYEMFRPMIATMLASDRLRAYARQYAVSSEEERQRREREAEAARVAEENKADDDAWARSGQESCRSATDPNACGAVDEYLRQFPTGRHASEARALSQEVRPRIRQLVEDRRWSAAAPDRCRAPVSSQNCDGVRAYVEEHPDGQHVAEANALLASTSKKIAVLKQHEERKAAREHFAEQVVFKKGGWAWYSVPMDDYDREQGESAATARYGRDTYCSRSRNPARAGFRCSIQPDSTLLNACRGEYLRLESLEQQRPPSARKSPSALLRAAAGSTGISLCPPGMEIENGYRDAACVRFFQANGFCKKGTPDLLSRGECVWTGCSAGTDVAKLRGGGGSISGCARCDHGGTFDIPETFRWWRSGEGGPHTILCKVKLGGT